MYEDLDTDVKGDYVGASGNPISTALERVLSLSSRVLTYPNPAILLRAHMYTYSYHFGVMPQQFI